MTKLYVMGYPGGACGDFLTSKVWISGEQWYSEPFEDRTPFHNVQPLRNTYWFHSHLHHVGISDKQHGGNNIIFKDDRYSGIPAGTQTTNITIQQAESVWNAIEEKFKGKNILTNTHAERLDYPWYDDRVKYIAINPLGVSSEITHAMCVLKSVHTSINSPDAFDKLPVDHPDIVKWRHTMPDRTWEEFNNRGWATRWEASEIQGHMYRDYVKIPHLPNPERWLQQKTSVRNSHYLSQTDYHINLGKIYEKDKSELDKLFYYFDVEEYDPKPIWNYIDTNIKMFESININGDWRQYVINYISERIF